MLTVASKVINFLGTHAENPSVETQHTIFYGNFLANALMKHVEFENILSPFIRAELRKLKRTVWEWYEYPCSYQFVFYILPGITHRINSVFIYNVHLKSFDEEIG